MSHLISMSNFIGFLGILVYTNNLNLLPHKFALPELCDIFSLPELSDISCQINAIGQKVLPKLMRGYED